MILRVVLACLALFLAMPAQAQICDPFYKPMTQAEAERYADDAKDGFPAKYRALLDNVKITLTADTVPGIAVEQGSAGAELLIPAGFMREHCLLSIGAAAFEDQALEDIGKGRQPSLGDLPKCPGKTQLDCLFEAIDHGINRPRDAYGQKLVTMLRYTVETAFVYAIAHEYGHVVADAEGAGRARPADYDAELEADILALHTLASNPGMLIGDSLLFGGAALREAVEGTPPGADGPHEPVICRAKRANAMRQRLIPPLSGIVQWNFSESGFAPAAAQLRKEGVVNFHFVPSKAKCRLTLPGQVDRTEHDFAMLNRLIATLPPPSKVTEAQLAAMRKLPLKTPIGNALRNGLVGGASVVRIMVLSGLLTTQADHAQRAELPRELARIDGLPHLQDMSSRAYRDFLYARATARFHGGPAGSHFGAQAKALLGELDRADAYGLYALPTYYAHAGALIMNDDCNGGIALLVEAADFHAAQVARFGYGLELTKVTVPEIPAHFGFLITLGRSLREEKRRLPDAECISLRRAVSRDLMTSYGWVD